MNVIKFCRASSCWGGGDTRKKVAHLSGFGDPLARLGSSLARVFDGGRYTNFDAVESSGSVQLSTRDQPTLKERVL